MPINLNDTFQSQYFIQDKKWQRYLKQQKQYKKDNIFFRNFGSLSGDSCVTDIYKKRIKANNKRTK